MTTIRKWSAAIFCGAAIISFLSFKGDKENFDVTKNIDIFSSVMKELNQFYVDSIQSEKVIRTGIDAMLSSLDPYTEYIPESESGDLNFIRTGEYGGVGSIISYREKDKAILVNEPYEGMPAALAGLKSGDKILKIDTVSMEGKMTADASELLKGEVGTKVKVTVSRDETPEPIVFELERKKIQINPVVYYGVVGQNTGYIYLSTFNDKTVVEVKRAFSELKNQKINSLILDLRGNGGGLMDQAIQLVNFFVPKGKEVLSTKGKIKQWDRTYRTSQSPVDTNIPVAVLVDGQSASASEIVSGALQDLDRAVVLGTRTYGKGLVQSVRDLPFNGQLKLTTAKYYIPSGRCIQELDYSSRLKNGGALTKVADTLSAEFKTSHGRTVTEGRGILPDFVVEPERLRNISAYLLRDYLIMEYAAYYLRHNNEIAPADNFALSDAGYAEFKEFVNKRDFTYDKQSIKALEDLKKVAAFEGYSEAAAEDFKALEAKLNHNIDSDLETSKGEIKELIEAEIIKQKYFQRGAAIYSLREDKVVKKAVEVLSNKDEYKKTLNLQ